MGSIAAAIGTSISYLAWMALLFGGDDEGGNSIVMPRWHPAPIAAA